MNDDIKEMLELHIKNDIDLLPKNQQKVLDYITNLQQENQELNNENEKWWAIIKDNEQEIKDLCLENSKLEQENEKLNREVAKLHIIQEEYGNHIENTHIIDDYQKTYFMTNKYLIELKNGKFVYVDELNDKYEDYKSQCEELQQENERLKKLDENYPIEEELAEAYRREEDYKSRCEKAVEIIDLIKPELWNISNKMTYRLIDIEKVLNGRSDE